ncbi:hypothetical protein DAPPUDRAFT_318776 [Daphnia pulex]|uniref:Uncharacterized protein n=1 Tax=Daphnia pulex TaxID=6669 RepID=E9GJN2_DAPPU|nr:hypothetical protein DAPPUDRAFT_318776 [Daphnia pulex]|eukprot:EFX80142.1 hypothetical protein DAPPUDRAFT_318776 [Daphnia pulex]
MGVSGKKCGNSESTEKMMKLLIDIFDVLNGRPICESITESYWNSHRGKDGKQKPGKKAIIEKMLSVIELTENYSMEEFDFFLTAGWNQDPLKRLFGQIRALKTQSCLYDECEECKKSVIITEDDPMNSPELALKANFSSSDPSFFTCNPKLKRDVDIRICKSQLCFGKVEPALLCTDCPEENGWQIRFYKGAIRTNEEDVAGLRKIIEEHEQKCSLMKKREEIIEEIQRQKENDAREK